MADGGDGTSGAGESGSEGGYAAPEGVPGKFFDSSTGETNLAGLGKAYTELEGKIRSQKSELTKSLSESIRAEIEAERFTNRPESADDYQVGVPDGVQLPDDVEWEVNPDDPMLGWWKEFVFEQGGDQAMFDKGIEMYLGAQVAMMPDIQAEMEQLGEHGPARVERVQLWGQNTLGEDAQEGFAELMSSAAGIQLMETIMDKMGEAPFSPQDFAYAGQEAPSPDILREMSNDPRYWDPGRREAAYVREVDAYAEALGAYEDQMRR